MYVTEIIDIGRKEIQGMEVAQNKVARVVLGANRYVTGDVLRGEMGWSSFEERVNKTKMKHQVKLEFMDENRWAKKIYRWNRNTSRVINDYRNRMLKLNMIVREYQEEIKLSIEGEEFIEGENQMNRRMRNDIEKKGLEKWKENMQGKNSLR